MPPCCEGESQPRVPVWAQLGLFLTGIGIDALPWLLGFSASVALVYWGAVALGTLGLLVVMRAHYLSYRRQVWLSCLVPLLWALGNVLAVDKILWSSALERAFVCLSSLQLYAALSKMLPRIGVWGQRCFSVVFSMLVCGCFYLLGYSLVYAATGSLLCYLFAYKLGQLSDVYVVRRGALHAAPEETPVLDALTIAMGTSWVYSFAQLLVASSQGLGSCCVFFSDVWKTLAVRFFSLDMQGRFASHCQIVVDGQERRTLSFMTQLVMAVAQVAGLGWLLAGYPLIKAVEVSASVLIVACPCVITLTRPLALWVEKHIGKENANPFRHLQMRVVWGYYVLSLGLASGLGAPLFGFEVRPWHVAASMLVPQAMLVLQAVWFVRRFGVGRVGGRKDGNLVFSGDSDALLSDDLKPKKEMIYEEGSTNQPSLASCYLSIRAA